MQEKSEPDEACPASRKRELRFLWVNHDLQTAAALGSRTLRSATKGKLVAAREPKKPMKCHVCRERMESFKLVACANFASCHHAFCFGCLDRHFKAETKKERIRKGAQNWVCFACRGVCRCPRCKLEVRREIDQLREDLQRDQPSIHPGSEDGNKNALPEPCDKPEPAVANIATHVVAADSGAKPAGTQVESSSGRPSAEVRSNPKADGKLAQNSAYSQAAVHYGNAQPQWEQQYPAGTYTDLLRGGYGVQQQILRRLQEMYAMGYQV